MVAALEHDASAPPARALVEVRDLHFSYDDNAVLKGINLAIPRGKVVAILGVSGCGKTTLLRHLGGQLMPSRGICMFVGHVVHEHVNACLYALRRNLGLLVQV